ncbi:hypothetical protein FSP39_006435 [Pinctada imbricata]|uniref:Uncharacterized protein n=1 Tax=Pinctada imbricata TaxID=66713 RepID=A0AA88YBG7_PINIB|nr:hypothetical protein FSP39_006435 [Pinctada imbricata]
MDFDNEAYKNSLRQSVVELRHLGEEWGMTEGEINSCIERALEEENVGGTKDSSQRNKNGFFSFIMLTFIMFTVIILGKPCSIVISSIIENINVFLRLLILPLRDFFNLVSSFFLYIFCKILIMIGV